MVTERTSGQATSSGPALSAKLLSAEGEARLSRRWLEDNDIEARNRLVDAFQPLARKMVARELRRVPKHKADAIRLDMLNEAGLGLMKAADKFDPDKGFRFSTYAQWWVRASLQDFLISDHSVVKVNKAGDQRRLFFQLRGLISKLESRHAKKGSSPASGQIIAEAAEILGIPRAVVEEFAGRVLKGDQSLNAPKRSEEGEGDEWVDGIQDESPNPEDLLLTRNATERARFLVQEGLECLTDRERDVVYSRRLNPDQAMTLEELGVKHGVTRERIRQIEVSAFAKMKKAASKLGARASDFHG